MTKLSNINSYTNIYIYLNVYDQVLKLAEQTQNNIWDW